MELGFVLELGFALLQLGNVDLTVATVVHVVFAGLSTGSVLFFAYAVAPAGRAGEIGPDLFAAATAKLATVNRVSAVLLFLTGSHQAGVLYTFETLTGTGRGHLVLAMLGLWLVMTALVEVAVSKLRDGLDREKVRTPARVARPYLRAASAVAVLLLVDAGLLASGVSL